MTTTETIVVDGLIYEIPSRTTRTCWHVQFTQGVPALRTGLATMLVLDEAHDEKLTIDEGLLRIKWHNGTVTLIPLAWVLSITSWEVKRGVEPDPDSVMGRHLPR